MKQQNKDNITLTVCEKICCDAEYLEKETQFAIMRIKLELQDFVNEMIFSDNRPRLTFWTKRYYHFTPERNPSEYFGENAKREVIMNASVVLAIPQQAQINEYVSVFQKENAFERILVLENKRFEFFGQMTNEIAVYKCTKCYE